MKRDRGYPRWDIGEALDACVILDNGLIYLCGYNGHGSCISWLSSWYKGEMQHCVLVTYDDMQLGGFFVTYPMQDRELTYEQRRIIETAIADREHTLCYDEQIIRRAFQAVLNRDKSIERRTVRVLSSLRNPY